MDRSDEEHSRTLITSSPALIVRCQKEQVTALEAIERGRTRAIVSASRVSLGRAHRMIDRMRALLSARAANEIPGRSGAG